jgi:hypothetical protein
MERGRPKKAEIKLSPRCASLQPPDNAIKNPAMFAIGRVHDMEWLASAAPTGAIASRINRFGSSPIDSSMTLPFSQKTPDRSSAFLPWSGR